MGTKRLYHTELAVKYVRKPTNSGFSGQADHNLQVHCRKPQKILTWLLCPLGTHFFVFLATLTEKLSVDKVHLSSHAVVHLKKLFLRLNLLNV